jgi:hypothetical protein
MELPKTCNRCGGDKVVTANVSDAGLVPKEGKRSFLSFGPEIAGMEAVACLTCGAVSFWADPEKVRAILSDPA